MPDVPIGSILASDDQFIYRRGRRFRLNDPRIRLPRSRVPKPRVRNGSEIPYTENKPKFEFKQEVYNGYWRNHISGFYGPNIRYGYEINQLLISRGNARTKNAWSGGGDFYVHKTIQKGNLNGPTLKFYAPTQPPWTTNPGKLYYTVKPLLQLGLGHPPTFPNVNPPSFDSEANSLINTYEATGRARTDPGKPLANNAQAIAELYRDGFRLVGRELINWRSGTTSLSGLGKALGGEWLNLQFGVLPTARDFANGISAVMKIDAAMTKLRNESGKTIRRKTTLKDTTTVTNSSVTWGWPFAEYEWSGDLNTLLDGSTIHSTTTITREKVWYVARYKYTMREPGPLSDLVTRAKLAGLVPSASLAWELLPWSWVVDWFSNVGDVMKNMSPSAADNLICLHSYLMKETETRTIHTYSGSFQEKDHSEYGWKCSQSSGSFHNTWEVSTITKMRVGGRNPYGFHFGWADLSTYQQSLLAALGISRGSFSKKP